MTDRTLLDHLSSCYREALAAFVRNVLEDPERNVFLAHFRPFQARIAQVAMYNSLAQILLKFTVSGVPDIYQGNELWDFSLVDPDNRRPVDYDQRAAMLRALQELAGLPLQERVQRVRDLLDSVQDGRVKLYVTWAIASVTPGLSGSLSPWGLLRAQRRRPEGGSCLCFGSALPGA